MNLILKYIQEIRDNWIDNIDWVKVKHLNPDESGGVKRPLEVCTAVKFAIRVASEMRQVKLCCGHYGPQI